METKQLGKTDLQITPIGFGAWALGGGGWIYAWGAQDDRDSIATIHRALDRGINWIDTAAAYGLGHSEEVVGRALKGMAQRPYVFTKCQLTWTARGEIVDCLKRDSLRRECEASLRRLGVDVIDLYQIHWPRPEEDLEEGWSALAELQQEGKVRWIGASNFNVAQLRRADKIAPVSSLQPPYSLIKPDIEREILPYCQAHQIGVIIYSPMYSGLLAGKMTRERIAAMQDDWRRDAVEFNPPRFDRNVRLVELLTEIGARHDTSPGAVAVAWTLRNPAVHGAIVGFRHPAQLDEILPATKLCLTDAELQALGSFLTANP